MGLFCSQQPLSSRQAGPPGGGVIKKGPAGEYMWGLIPAPASVRSSLSKLVPGFLGMPLGPSVGPGTSRVGATGNTGQPRKPTLPLNMTPNPACRYPDLTKSVVSAVFFVGGGGGGGPQSTTT